VAEERAIELGLTPDQWRIQTFAREEGLRTHRFPDAWGALRDGLGMRVFGGCCGTDETHIEALDGRLSRSPTP
jgi:S-methylmethionine-dependent homocysteine/selenocysteine methylase